MHSQEFDRLERFIDVIARQPDHPRKQVIWHECLGMIEEGSRKGQLTPDQKDKLLAILMGR